MSGDGPSYKTKKFKGDIEIDGSSTVFPITQAVAEEFMVNYQQMEPLIYKLIKKNVSQIITPLNILNLGDLGL